jgi:hypothetical protein
LGAFPGTDAASFAKIQIRRKIRFVYHLHDLDRAIDRAKPAENAFFFIHDRPFAPPVTGIGAQ